MKKRQREGLQGATFGMMEGVVMVIAMLFGLSAAGVDQHVIIVTLLLTAFADGVANTSAFYVSEETETFHTRREIHKSAFWTFVGTAIAFAIPVTPLFFLPIHEAVIAGTLIGSIMLILLGQFVGKVAKRNRMMLSVKYLIIGIIAAIVAFIAGQIIELLL